MGRLAIVARHCTPVKMEAINTEIDLHQLNADGDQEKEYQDSFTLQVHLLLSVA